MDVISEFIMRYRKEYDFYEKASRFVQQTLDASLQSAGVRAIVTSRAKNPLRLEAKVRQRDIQAKYQSVQEIYDDIVDLAGVRVALYFPGERDEVGKIVRSALSIVGQPRVFPADAKPSYRKRFSGYWATHYRVRLNDGIEANKRFAEAMVEVQVASVLMHAWSEVEHDLVYKPLQGELSEEEYAILDELNGLVLAGEIALERLQRAGELRVSVRDRSYASHYDLAASLVELSRDNLGGADLSDAAMGRVDLLYQLLVNAGLDTPEKLARYVEALHSDFERRPLAEQIIDEILAEDSSRYALYEAARAAAPGPFVDVADGVPQTKAIGEFIELWIEFERRVRELGQAELSRREHPSSSIVPPSGRLLAMMNLPKDILASAERLRRLRNKLVHGLDAPDAESLAAGIEELRGLIQTPPFKQDPNRAE